MHLCENNFNVLCWCKQYGDGYWCALMSYILSVEVVWPLSYSKFCFQVSADYSFNLDLQEISGRRDTSYIYNSVELENVYNSYVLCWIVSLLQFTAIISLYTDIASMLPAFFVQLSIFTIYLLPESVLWKWGDVLSTCTIISDTTKHIHMLYGCSPWWFSANNNT